MDNKNTRKNKIIKITALLGLFLLVFGISYALFSVVLEGTKKNKISTGKLELNLTDTNKNPETDGFAINLEEAVPMTEEEGLETTPYKFVVSNTGTIPASYKLKLSDIDGVTNTLEDKYIRYNLIRKDYYDYETYYEGKFAEGMHDSSIYNKIDTSDYGDSLLTYLSNLKDRVLDETTLLPGECIEYTLNLWLDYDADNSAMGKTFEGKIKIEGTQVQVFSEGKAGENINYTYYNDGTLILTGTGPMNGFVLDENYNFVSMANNISPIMDIAYNYLKKKNMPVNDLEINENGEMVNLLYSYTNLFTDRLYIMVNRYSDGSSDYDIYDHIEYCAGDHGSVCDDYREFVEPFNGDVEQAKLAAKYVLEIPLLKRIVIGKGITKISVNSLYVDGMLSLPNTLTNIDPSAIQADFVNIPNSVEYIDDSGIDEFSWRIIDGPTLNIDNTKEFVDTNWHENWYAHNGNSIFNYLR